MIEWKDTTSYSQSNKQRIPSVLEFKIDNVDIIVHRYVGCSGWFLSSHNLRIDKKSLIGEDVEACKIQAIGFVREYIKDSIEKLQSVLFKIN